MNSFHYTVTDNCLADAKNGGNATVLIIQHVRTGIYVIVMEFAKFRGFSLPSCYMTGVLDISDFARRTT
jgi:hypothetical protein